MTIEVKTKLVVDDAGSSGVLQKLKKSFEETSAAQKAAQTGMGFFKSTLSMAVGSYLPQGVQQVRAFGESFIAAARNNAKYIGSITGLISTMQNIPWQKAKAQATALDDHLDTLALNQGKNADDVAAAFQVMTEIGGGTVAEIEKSKKAVEQLTIVSRVLGLSTENSAREYQMMGDGILRTRGMMFQLLQSTGIFGDRTKGAAAAWAKLTDEKRAAQLEKGMASLAGNMGKMPLGMGALLQQITTMEELMKEQLGTPLLQAIVPQIRKLVGWMKEGRGSIEEFTKAMVVDVAKYAEDAARVIREGWAYIKGHSEEIKNDIMMAFGFAKTVLQFAVDHKDALMIAYGAKTILGSGIASQAFGVGKSMYAAGAAGGITTVGKIGGGLGTAVKGGGAITEYAGKAGAKMAGTLKGGAALSGYTSAAAVGTGALGGVVALGAFAAAIGAVAFAASQGAKLMKELDDDKMADARARQEYFENLTKKENAGYTARTAAEVEHFEMTKSRFVASAKTIGMSKAEAAALADAADAQHIANRQMVMYAEDAARGIERAAKKSDGWGIEMGEQKSMVAPIVEQFQAANGVMDAGAQEYIANLLSKSSVLQKAFLESADMTSVGFMALAELTRTSAAEFSEALKGLGDAAAKREKSAAKSPAVNFNGGQTFKIQQDFRDQDPDRIAVVFQRDILRSAESRYQSASASPFGT